MRNLLALIGLAVVVVAVVGWYRNWYTVENSPGQGGHPSLSIDFDREKIEGDLHKGGEKLHQAIDRAQQEVKSREQTRRESPHNEPRQ